MRAISIAISVVLAACVQLPYTGGATPVSQVARGSIDDHWLRAAPTPIVRQQQETDCGLAALAMVAGAWGRQWSVAELAHRITPTSQGVRLGALRDLARARGLDAYALAATTQDLTRELRAGRPMMLGLVLPFDRGHDRSHYEVAIAMDPDSGTVITIDPASGRWMRRTRAVLEQEWNTAGHVALVVAGTRDASIGRRGDSP